MQKTKQTPEQYRRVQEALKEKNLDAMLAISMENFFWLSQSLVTTMKSIPDRLGIVLTPLNEEPTILVCSIEESLVRDDSWIQDIQTYEEFTQSPIAVLAEIMRKRGLSHSRIGIEMDYIVARYYDELKRELPDIELVDVSDTYRKLRMIKTPKEIEILAYAARSTEEAITRAFWEAKPGDKEIDVLNNMIIKTLKSGGSQPSGSFGTGPKSAIAHPIADKSPLKNGEIVSVDFGACYGGYYSDIGRTAVVGQSNARQNEIYTSLYDVQRYLIDMVRPGIKACSLYFKAVELLEKAGLKLSLSHVGHGIGLAIHEDPLLSPLNEQVLMENMIINIEPFYVTDEGYHSEDTLIVTSDGCRILSDFADHSKIIPITEKGE